MKGDNISERLMEFAVGSISYAKAIPRNYLGRHVASQLIRSSTSAGANYEEARGAESKSDFAHKLGVATKELWESSYWLRLSNRAFAVDGDSASMLNKESRELVAILTASIKTAREGVGV